MQLDALKQFIHLRAQLTHERARLETRIREIGEALGDHAAAAPTLKAPRAPTPMPRTPRGIENPISLKKAVIKVTAKNPLTKQEIFAAVQKLGWKTTSRKPRKLLDTLLYGKNPNFKNQNGQFSPA